MLCRVSGFRLSVFLFPLVVDQIQKGAQLPGRSATLGGEFSPRSMLTHVTRAHALVVPMRKPSVLCDGSDFTGEKQSGTL